MKEKVVSTKKMKVEINSDSVTKNFKPSFGYKKRYQTEKKALNLLQDIERIPKILSFSDDSVSITMTKIDGENATHFSDQTLRDLKTKMLSTIEHGVARHSLPVRDLLVDTNQNIGIVDFERASIKEDTPNIIWKVATLVTRFHTYRFIYRHNPNVLEPNELKLVENGLFVRKIFNFYKEIRNSIRNSYRKLFKIQPK